MAKVSVTANHSLTKKKLFLQEFLVPLWEKILAEGTSVFWCFLGFVFSIPATSNKALHTTVPGIVLGAAENCAALSAAAGAFCCFQAGAQLSETHWMWCLCTTEVTCGGNKSPGKKLGQFGAATPGSVNSGHKLSCLTRSILCQSVAQKEVKIPIYFFVLYVNC